MLGDVLFRLPLSIFVTLVTINTDIPELEAYLDHPIRRYYLVSALPEKMRRKLLRSNYVSTVREIINRLCYIGTLCYGPNVVKERDQVHKLHKIIVNA